MYKWIGVFVVFCNFSANAQKLTDYKTIDSLSYSLYANSKWQELSEINTAKNIDYHYLNLRKGIAFYHLKKYHRAERYLLKAYEQNKSSEVAASYLYSSSIKTENLFLTSELHSAVVGDSIKFTKIISSINAGGGLKLSGNRNAAGNINFFSVGIGHLPSKKIALYQSFSYQNQQNNIWGNYNQQQYYIDGSVKLNNKWSIDVGAHLHKYKANIDFKYDSTKITSSPPQFPDDFKTDSIYRRNHLLKGDYSQQGALLYLGLTRISGAFKLSPFIELNLENPTSEIIETQWTSIEINKIKPNSPPINTKLNKDTTIKSVYYPNNVKQLIVGASIQYTLPIFNEKFTIGLSIYQPIKRNHKTILSPFGKIKFVKGSLFVSYLRKDDIPIAEYYASILENSYNKIHNQINTQFNYPLSKKTSLNLLYQWEDKTDALSLVRSKSNMFSLSLFFKL